MEKTTLSVTQVNTLIKDFLENLPPLRSVTVKGELSNVTLHRSGHIYMTLKDEESMLKAVMFASQASKLAFKPKNGDKVIVQGRVSVYTRDGVYQLYANSMELEGVGSLYAAFEMLKQKLEAEGLFSPMHKRRLPAVPCSIGIVTAPTGAAIRDMINISGRRFPGCEIVLYPSLVQGSGAAQNIIKGIEYFNSTDRVELIIIGRGGGSIEDLWAFNEEILARAVYNSRIPVISAVGHETDFTITDFTADLRAPTPSAAMELALPDVNEMLRKFENVRSKISRSLSQRLESEKKLLRLLSSSGALTAPERLYQEKSDTLARLGDRLDSAVTASDEKHKRELSSYSALLKSFNPLAVLGRGYSVAYGKDGRIIYKKEDIAVGESFALRVSDGMISAVREESTERNEISNG